MVEVAMQGQKCAKTFKRPALKHVVHIVNKKFMTSFEMDNVKNHLKQFKNRWRDITVHMRHTGTGWNQEEKKIVFEKTLADCLISVREILFIRIITITIVLVLNLKTYRSLSYI